MSLPSTIRLPTIPPSEYTGSIDIFCVELCSESHYPGMSESSRDSEGRPTTRIWSWIPLKRNVWIFHIRFKGAAELTRIHSPESSTVYHVQRRFNDFIQLHSILSNSKDNSLSILPPLPQANVPVPLEFPSRLLTGSFLSSQQQKRQRYLFHLSATGEEPFMDQISTTETKLPRKLLRRIVQLQFYLDSLWQLTSFREPLLAFLTLEPLQWAVAYRIGWKSPQHSLANNVEEQNYRKSSQFETLSNDSNNLLKPNSPCHNETMMEKSVSVVSSCSERSTSFTMTIPSDEEGLSIRTERHQSLLNPSRSPTASNPHGSSHFPNTLAYSPIPDCFRDTSLSLEEALKCQAEMLCALRVFHGALKQNTGLLVSPSHSPSGASPCEVDPLTHSALQCLQSALTASTAVTTAGAVEGYFRTDPFAESQTPPEWQFIVSQPEDPIARMTQLLSKTLMCVPRGNRRVAVLDIYSYWIDFGEGVQSQLRCLLRFTEQQRPTWRLTFVKFAKMQFAMLQCLQSEFWYVI